MPIRRLLKSFVEAKCPAIRAEGRETIDKTNDTRIYFMTPKSLYFTC